MYIRTEYTKSLAIFDATYKTCTISMFSAVTAGIVTYLVEAIRPLTWEQIFWIHAFLFMLICETMAVEFAEKSKTLPIFFGPVVITAVSGMLFSEVSLIYVGTVMGLYLHSLRESWYHIGLVFGPPP